MCSFIALNQEGQEEALHKANTFTKRRGPDSTGTLSRGGWTMLHNLLSITGAITPQPFFDQEGKYACFFNGEIYNWKSLGVSGVSSDGQTLLPLYREHGTEFIKKLDGEFALVLFDFEKKVAVFATDPFATKPLWVGNEGGKIGLASYESALLSLGFEAPEKIPANTIRTISLLDGSLMDEEEVFHFDPTQQHKDSVEDYLNAFSRAIQKRTEGVREKVFIGLSSGYDSGAIALELESQQVPFKAWSIRGKENTRVLEARHSLLSYGKGELLDPGYRVYQQEKEELKEVCERFVESLHPNRYEPKNILEDAGAIGLGIICKRAKAEGYKIYLSGQGADEILSDYRMHGHGLTGHSSISGAFPENLEAEFPWHNFYGGAQKFYIAKEEHVAGAYGIEARYPFLDKTLVQEFLYLTPNMKNAAYKYPLMALFEKHGYPYVPNTKVGFVPRQKTLVDYLFRSLDLFRL